MGLKSHEPASAQTYLCACVILCPACLPPPLQVVLRARMLRFDFDGRSDGRSMRTMLAHVAPRHCILVHGSTQVGRECVVGMWVVGREGAQAAAGV